METQAVGTRGGADSQSQVFRFRQTCCGRAASANTAIGGEGSPELWRSHGVSEGQGLPRNRARISLPSSDQPLSLLLSGMSISCSVYLQSQQLSLQVCLGEIKGHSLCMRSSSQAPQSARGSSSPANLLKSQGASPNGRDWTPFSPESVAQSWQPCVHRDMRVRC